MTDHFAGAILPWMRVRSGGILGRAATATVAAFAVAAPVASAEWTVDLDGDQLLVRGSGGQDLLTLTREPTDTYRITQAKPEVSLGTVDPACTGATRPDQSTEVECTAPVDVIRIGTRNGLDRFGVGDEFPTFHERFACSEQPLGASLVVKMGGGFDVAQGGPGRDELRGGGRHDLLMGCGGDDTLIGYLGSDVLSGDRGDDLARGHSQDDRLIGCIYRPDDPDHPENEPGRDRLRGANERDFLLGCSGPDELAGGRNNDTINAIDQSRDWVTCGHGEDSILSDPADRLAGCES